MDQIVATSESSTQRFLTFARQRDARLLEDLLRDHLDTIYTQAMRMLGNPSDAEDAVQEALLKLVRTAHRYDGSVPFAAWLGRLVYTSAIDLMRANRQRRRRESLIRAAAVTAAEPGDDWQLDMIRDEIAELSDSYRMPLTLHYYAGLSLYEIASALGVTANVVGMRLNRARDLVRERLRRHGILVSSAVALAAITPGPVHAAPPALVAAAQAGALAHAAATAATFTIGIPVAVGLVALAVGTAGVIASWLLAAPAPALTVNTMAETSVVAVDSRTPPAVDANSRTPPEVTADPGTPPAVAADSRPPPAPTPQPNVTVINGTINPGGLIKERGFAYQIPITERPGDSLADPTVSRLRLFEDGVELEPAHAKHDDIRALGAGRFSHWAAPDVVSLYLSASDNSDPRTNGRTYTYRIENPTTPDF